MRALLFFGFVVLAGCDSGPPAPITMPPPRGYLVVAADPLVTAGAEFAAYRSWGGFTARSVGVSELLAGAGPDQLAPAVRAALAQMSASLPPGAPLFLLLLGDAPGPTESTVGQVPALACENALGGCHTDNPYGDLDGDGLPEAAVARVPARTVARAEAYLTRLKAHEASYEPGPWNRRLSLYTGRPNFDPQLDAIIEKGVMEGLKHISHAFDVVGAYDNPASPYYYQPFDEKALAMFTDGAVMVVYVGHGNSTWTEGLTLDQVARMRCEHRLPIAVFIACTNGQYVGPDDSIAEALVWQDRGPIAAIGAADLSHPYANAAFVYELMRATLDGQPSTLGEAFRSSKRALVQPGDEFRRLVDVLAGGAVPPEEQPLLRAQHVNLYNLFGDPATSLQLPRGHVGVSPLPEVPLVGGSLDVRGTTPGVVEGSVRVTLEAERDVILQPLAPVDPNQPDTATVQANWQKAVDKVVVGVTAPVHDGAFAATLRWTPPLPGGDYYVKAYAQNANSDSFGAVTVP